MGGQEGRGVLGWMVKERGSGVSRGPESRTGGNLSREGKGEQNRGWSKLRQQ